MHVLIANSISANSAIPVAIIIGLPVLAIFCNNGISFISNDATLYADTPIFSKKSTAERSNGEENNSIPTSCAYLYKSSCHSHGVYAFSYKLCNVSPSHNVPCFI